MNTQKFQKQSWQWLLLVALLLGLVLPASAISAARLDDVPEEEVLPPDESWYETTDDEELLLYLVLIETASAEMDGVINALDQFRRGDEKNACRTLEAALFWMIALPEFVWGPYEYDDISEGVAVGAELAADGLFPIYTICNNGKNDRLTEFEYGLAFTQLDKARGILRVKSAEAQDRAGITVQSEPELLTELTAVAQEFLGVMTSEAYGDVFTTDIFRASVEISIEALHYMAGWIDRYNAGETVYCLEYVYYYALLYPALYTGVPDVYQYWVAEHDDTIDLVNDTTLPLIDFCISLEDNPGQPVPQFMVDQARHGIAQALVRANRVLENIR